MAEGLLIYITQSKYEIFRAGTKPSFVCSEVIEVLREIRIDISKNRSKLVNEFTNQKIDFVLTVCDSAWEICPHFPAQTKLVYHSFADPAEIQGDEKTRLRAFRNVRDQIQKYLEDFFCEIIGRK